MIRVLNLYAGIGGNRKLWPESCEVTAVEHDEGIAKIYQDFFPNDKVVVADAHQYLLEHYKEFDFIWSSPPCPSHSVCNHFLNAQGHIRYPDMALYQEIIFLKTFFFGKWVVENVKPYYEPLIRPYEVGRHCFWSNFYVSKENGLKLPFNIANAMATTRRDSVNELLDLEKFHGFDLSKYKHKNIRLLLRNCVYPPLGRYVFDCAFSVKQSTLIEGAKS